MEPVEILLRKIPIALTNLQVPSPLFVPLNNYICNLVLSVLKDPELRRRLHDEPERLLEELRKI